VPIFGTICIVGSIYAGLIALGQKDLKKIIAYSSISHMNFCLLGIFSGNFTGIMGSILMAIGHGFVSTGLFFLVGLLYQRYHTRAIDYFSGLINVMPVFSFFCFMFIISNFSFPLSLNFVGELLLLIGIGK